MITFSPVRFDDDALRRYETLFFTCFGAAEKFGPAALRWLYAENPDGPVVGFDALDGDRLAAHYVCIPAKVRIEGETINALLSLNTATHPDYQGKGLFSRLAEMTYQAGAERGFHSVYGVANSNSTPGFVRKLGFELVQPLEAMVGVGRLGVDFHRAVDSAGFQRVWSPESLRWRCANPSNPISVFSVPGGMGFKARAFGAYLPAYAELQGDVFPGELECAPLTPLRLYLGLMPRGTCRFSCYGSIPRRMRPSPLNLIYRSLTKSDVRLEAGRVLFSFLDFDAY